MTSVTTRQTIPTAPPGETMQFSRLTADYRRHMLMSRGASRRTEESYDLGYRQFLAYLDSIGHKDSVKALDPDVIQGFITWLLERGAKRSSVCRKLSALSSLAMWAKTRKDDAGKYILAENPLERIERPRPERPRREFLTADEVRAILTVRCHACERLALRLLIETQCRVSELVNAKVGDLTLEGDRIALRVTLKGGREHVKRLPEDLGLQAVLRQREAQPHEPLIVNTVGHAYNRSSLSEVVAKLARRAGITRIKRVGPHLLARHTVASLAAQGGASVPQIAAMLGHADLSSARHYVHGVEADAVRDKVRALWQ